MLVNMASLIHAPHSVRVQLIIFDILMISCGFIGASRGCVQACSISNNSSLSAIVALCFIMDCTSDSLDHCVLSFTCAASVSTQVGWRYVWFVISSIFFVGIFKILFHQNAIMDKVQREIGY
jgi:hypothetical protein